MGPREDPYGEKRNAYLLPRMEREALQQAVALLCLCNVYGSSRSRILLQECDPTVLYHLSSEMARMLILPTWLPDSRILSKVAKHSPGLLQLEHILLTAETN